MYIKFTYVDSQGQPVDLSRPHDALKFPALPGIQLNWTAESKFPTNTPEFYGECAPCQLPAYVTALTADEYGQAYSAELEARRWKRVPRTISARQAKLALIDAGYYRAVEAALSAISGDEGLKAQVSWEYASEFDRLDPLVLTILSAIGLDEEAGDNLFIAAGQL